MIRAPLIALSLLASTSCNDADGSNVVVAAPTAAVSPTPTLVWGKAIPTNVSQPCGTTMRQRTSCMIELILADVRDNYNEADGGGIGDINGHSSTSYTVSLPQEERLDLFRYEFDVSPTAVTMKSKTPGAH
jgi:hypothetical protein